MMSDQLKCMKPGHEKEDILGICKNEQCQANKRTFCLLCLQTTEHGKCMNNFYNKKQFLEKLSELKTKIQQDKLPHELQLLNESAYKANQFIQSLEQFTNIILHNYHPAHRIQRIDLILQKSDLISCNDWEQGYKMLTNQVLSALPDTTKLIESIKQIQQTIDKITAILVNNKTINQKLPSSLCSFEFYNKILKKINKNVQIRQTLYKLGQDAKDHALVWERINGKANTLMFIKLENNEIIGAYTPAIWNNKLTNFIADDSGMSFLFSVSKKQIYPLFIKQYAIYCSSDYLPTFGGGHDLYLSNDFTLGFSNLGHTYQSKKYQIVDIKPSHLANAASSAIKEFEIYELILS